MQLSPNEIQVWHTPLLLSDEQTQAYLKTLSDEEISRAHRFHFPIHQQRFIAARYTLRQILSQYLDLAPQSLEFNYTEHGKPYLSFPHKTPLQFNLAHSENIAVYALTLNDAIGVDIEFIQPTFNHDIIKRFCSSAENTAFDQLPLAAQRDHFFCLWSRKEAVIKAVGKGLALPLNEFSVSIHPVTETLALEGKKWTVAPLSIHPDYQCSLAYQKTADEAKIIKQMCF